MKYYIMSVDSCDVSLTFADSVKNIRISFASQNSEDLLGLLMPGDILVIKRDVPADAANVVIRKETASGEFRKILETEQGASVTDLLDGKLNKETLKEISEETYHAIINRMVEPLCNYSGESMDDDAETRVKNGKNDLYYGVPGSGKSHKVDGVIGNSKYERVVFHPDYTYSDFVGQIMPRLKANEAGQEKLTYEFVPGPFTNALKAAEEHKREMIYLIIEEINRGNAPAIFGDVFQLLDREKDGTGKYCITNYDIAKEVYGKDNADKPIRIPSNLTILATMNTSDQNVFTLDTAFQRRWNMKYITNDVRAPKHSDNYVDDRNEITWGDFAFFVNNRIVEFSSEMSSTEDKQLGAYFIQEKDLNKEDFAEKALKYLWDDVFRMERYEFFDSRIKSIGQLINTYQTAEEKPLRRVMKADVYKRMMDMHADSAADAVDENEIFGAEPLDEEQ